MTGRGVDQILPFPSEPELHEPYVKSALDYVDLAENKSGPIPRHVAPDYIWGDALSEIRERPDVRIINLETPVTQSPHWEDKGINYRMHPKNVACLAAARIDCCTLANNHVLDWGVEGLMETLETLTSAGIPYTGAGRDLNEAARPAIIECPGKGRVLVFGLGSPSSGVPAEWEATSQKPGVHLVHERDFTSALERIEANLRQIRRPHDIVVVSIHWGENWGYEIPREQRTFAHAMIDAGVDVVHGHSSHHVKGIEVYRRRLILYGCGDLISDYEGISGYEEFRGDIGLLYFPTLSSHGELVSLEMIPMRMQRLRLVRASPEDAAWAAQILTEKRHELGTAVSLKGLALELTSESLFRAVPV